MKKWKSRMFLVVLAITVALGLSLNPGLVKALSLADLAQQGAFIIIDDKKFSNFGCAWIGWGGAVPIPASEITVTPSPRLSTQASSSALSGLWGPEKEWIR